MTTALGDEIDRLRAELEALEIVTDAWLEALPECKWLAEVPDHIKQMREANAILEAALKPFAHFADQWDKNPLRGVATDRTYVIHAGSNEGVFSLEQCYAARTALAKAKQLQEGK